MEDDTSPLQTVPPISRPTLLMRDRKYTNPVRLNDMQEAVGEAPDELVLVSSPTSWNASGLASTFSTASSSATRNNKPSPGTLSS